MKLTKNHHIVKYLEHHGKLIALLFVAFICIVSVIFQLFYSSDKLLPFAKVDGVDLSGLTRSEAVKALDDKYAALDISLTAIKSDNLVASAKLAALGIDISNVERIDKLNYPWFLRLMPFSIYWAHLVYHQSLPTYKAHEDILRNFLAATFGEDCIVKPTDPKIYESDGTLAVKPGVNGGTCDLEHMTTGISERNFTLLDAAYMISITDEKKPAVEDSKATELAKTLVENIGDKVKLVVAGKDVYIPKLEIYSWLVYEEQDGHLVYSLSLEKSKAYLDANVDKLVYVAPGTSKVTTVDEIQVAKTAAADGTELDDEATTASIYEVVSSKSKEAKGITKVAPPILDYDKKSSTTDSAIDAVIKQYVESHIGSYAVSYFQPSGSYKSAGYDIDVSYVTASTYKLYVAYSVLLRIESGEFKWSDYAQPGRNLSVCFDDMISKSDNECAVSMLMRVGRANVTNDAHAIGSTHTSFVTGSDIITTARDLTNILVRLYTGQILNSQSDRDKMINAMKNNVYRSGIPSGVSGTVADKVGFLDALLHDASIVYTSKGDYVLIILTENSSWGNIAELAGEIDGLVK